jgi:hypothetical protein
MRAGVKLSPLKARLFDAVKRSGGAGIEVQRLLAIVYDGHGTRPAHWESIKSHIYQINELLEDAGLRIVSSRGRYPSWTLVRT